MFKSGQDVFEDFQERLGKFIDDKLKGTIYENDIETYSNIYNNICSTIDDMMFADINTTEEMYFDLAKKELLALGIE